MATIISSDRVRETTTTTGTGTLDLDGAVTNYQTFVDGAGDTSIVTYCIIHRDAAEWEVGYGTVTDATPDTLSRTSVSASSNAGSAVNLSSGTKDVFITHSAEYVATKNTDGNINVSDGGTDISSYTIGDLLYADGSTSLTKLSDIATGNVLLSGGVGAAPSYGKVTSVHVDSSIYTTSNPQTSVTGNAATVTVADESSDATCFPLFATDATGDLEPKTHSGLLFNATSGQLTLPQNLILPDANDIGWGSITTLIQGSSSANTLSFLTNSTNRMYITSAGLVGLGTTSPKGALDIVNTNSVISTYGNLNILTTDTQAQDKGGQINFGGVYSALNRTQWAAIKGGKENGTTGNFAGYLAFATRANGGSTTERIRISSDGNVGIGGTPSNKMHVMSSTGSEMLRIEDTGASSTTDANPYIGFRGFSTNLGYVGYGSSGNLNMAIINYMTGDLVFYTDSTLALTLDSNQDAKFSGNVGIGTSSPSALIHGIKTTEQLRLGYDASNYASFTTTAIGHLLIAPTGNLYVDSCALMMSASTTARPTANIPSGTAPTSPTDGDIWYDGTNLYFRHSGTTRTIDWT